MPKQILTYVGKSPAFLLLLLAELAILIAVSTQFSSTPPRFSVDLSPGNAEIALSTDPDGYTGVAESGVVADYDVILTSGLMTLPKGRYTVTVHYKAESWTDGEGTQHYPGVSFYTDQSGTLRRYSGSLDPAKRSQRFLVVVDRECTDAEILLHNSGCRYLVKDVSIERVDAFPVALVGFLLLLFVAGDLLLLRLLPGSPVAMAPGGRLAVPALLAIFVVGSLLLFQPHMPGGDDLFFHATRIEGIADALKNGQFPVRTYTMVKNGYGYAPSLFYGELFLYFPALLRLLGFTVQEAFAAYLLAVNAATVALSYFCFRRMFGRRSLAVLGSFLYTLAAYRLICLHTRMAVGEFTAMAFLPLLAYGLWLLYGKNAPRPAWVPLMLAFAALLQCHMLTFLMTAATTLVLVLVFWRRTFRRDALLCWLKAAGGCILLNLWFLLPFAFSIGGIVSIGEAGLSGNAVTVAQLFLQGRTATFSMTLVPGMVVFLALCLYGRRDDLNRRAGLTALAVGAAALLLCTDLFPWAAVEGLPVLGKIAQTLQFPWRWLGTASLAGTLVTLCAVKELAEDGWRSLALLLAGLEIGLALVWVTNYDLPKVNLDVEPDYGTVDGSQLSNAGNDAILWGMDNMYLPTGARAEGGGFAHCDPQGVVIEGVWQENGRTYVTCSSETGGTAELPILWYRGYTVKSGGGSLYFSDHGLVGLTLPAGWSGTVEIARREPRLWIAADLASLAGAAVFLVAGLRRKRPGKRKEKAS